MIPIEIHPDKIVSHVDGVVFTMPIEGPAIATFESESQSTKAVLLAVDHYCNNCALNLGAFDFRVTFNIPSHPDDYVRGTVELIGF